MKLRYLLKIVFFLFVFQSLAGHTIAQKQNKRNGTDSVHVAGRSFLILGDSSIYIEQDTIILLPDSVAAKIKLDRTERSAEFYRKLRESFHKRRFTKELYKLLFEDPADSKPKPKTQPVIVRNYDPYEGKTIRSVIIKKLEVFGTSINDTSKHVDKWGINLGNSLHYYTRSRIIKNNIFFEEGDKVEPDLLADSERILRSLPYIKDARVYIVSKPEEEEAEVLILVKDVWSISPEFEYSSVDKFDVTVNDRNFLGLGQSFRNEFTYDVDDDPEIGYSGTYSVNNIYKTFITGRLQVAQSQSVDRVGINFFRNFITPETRYAGGLSIIKERRELHRIFTDTTIVFDVKYNTQNFWLGRSFLIRETENSRTNIELAGRAARINHLERPIVEVDTNQQFFDHHIYLFSLGLTSRSYERSSLVAGFGRTEDIPIGYLAAITGGKEINQFYNRTYWGARLAYGNFIERIGYVRPMLSLGSFFRNNRAEQGVVRWRVQYFSYLYRFNRTNFRQFFNLSYTLGIRRFDNEFVSINDENGVRGLSYTFLRGTRKLNFSAETIAFTPLYVLGFRFAPFLFVDLAVVNDQYTKLLKNKLYQGYGLGVRLRNENLAFNTIQIRLAWYPVLPPGISEFNWDLSGKNQLGIDDFQTGEPMPVRFE